jgi:hypothetical protein
MIKNLLALIVLSIAVILTMTYAQTGLHALLSAYDWISATLKQVFSDGPAGNLSRELLALLFVPFIVGMIPALLYWFAKRTWFPYFMQLVWVTWLVQTAAIVILYKSAT